MRDHSIAGLGLSLSPREEGFFCHTILLHCSFRKEGKKSEIFNHSIEMCKKLWNPEPWKLRSQAVNKKNPNSISLPKLLILSFLMSPLWSKIHYFLFFFFLYRQSLKEEERAPKFALVDISQWRCTTEYAWEETFRGDSYQALKSLFKRTEKDFFWNTFAGQDPIPLASAWRNADSLKAAHVAKHCRAGTSKSTLKSWT